MGLTLKQKEKFYRNKNRVKKIILKNVRKKGHVIFGARATNKLFPSFLDVPTEDYDVFTKTPRKTARKIEKKLDKEFGGNFFKVKPTKFPGGFRVVSNVTKKVVADYIPSPEEKIKTVKRGGIKYASLEIAKKNIRKSLKDPKSKFRREKDLALRDRIRIFEKLREKKRRARKIDKFAPMIKFRPNLRVSI